MTRPPSRASTPLSTNNSALPVELFQLVYSHASTGQPHQLPLARVRRHLDALHNPQVQGLPRSLGDVKKHIHALAERFRIQADSHDTLGQQLENGLQRLFVASQQDQGELRSDRLPDALQLLLCLASPPSSTTLEYANMLSLDPPRPESSQALNWNDLIAGYDGEQDWVPRVTGPSAPSPSSDEEGALSSSSSSHSGAENFPPTPDAIRTRPRGTRRSFQSTTMPRGASSVLRPVQADYDARAALIKTQFWSGLQPLSFESKQFQPDDPTTLAAGLRANSRHDDYLGLDATYWSEVDAYREVLGALQGRKDAGLFVRTNKGFEVSTRAPSLQHLSPEAFHSLLASFTPTLALLSTIDAFLSRTILQRSDSSARPWNWSSSIDAFACSINDSVLRPYRDRCISLEANLLSPSEDSAISLLQLSDSVQANLELVSLINRLIKGLDSHPSSTPSSQITSTLLDDLQESIDLARSIASPLETTLIEIWCATCTPLWRSLGDWVQHGRLVRGQSDFFIRKNDELEPSDPEFFTDGFLIEGTVPRFLMGVAKEIEECGKAIGLWKTLMAGSEGVEDRMEWPDLREVVGAARNVGDKDVVSRKTTTCLIPSLDELQVSAHTPAPQSATQVPPTSSLISFSQSTTFAIESLLSPLFQVVHHKLHRIISDDCQFAHHLVAIQNVFLMRSGWVVGEFLSEVFDKMDRQLPWSDFHSLNSAWTRAASSGPSCDPRMTSLVRFRATRMSRGSLRSVKVFNELKIDYAVPWPLGYIFTPSTLSAYSQIFIFLVSIRRQKHLIDRLSLLKISASLPGLPPPTQLRAFYALRRKLGWIIEVLWEFFMSFVIESEIQSFGKMLDGMKELGALIEEHARHVEGLKVRLLLDESAVSVHRSILAILDLGIELADTWSSLTEPEEGGGNATQLGGTSTSKRKKRPAHRPKRRTTSSSSSDSDSDSSDELSSEDDDEGTTTPNAYPSFVSFVDESFQARIVRMRDELESTVGFMRRSVEGLARGAASQGAREVFGMLEGRLMAWNHGEEEGW